MIVRLGLALVASFLLLGCQSTPAEQQWSRSGATVEDVKRDLYWCSSFQRPRPEAEGTPASERPATRRIDDECMEKRGYSKVAPKS